MLIWSAGDAQFLDYGETVPAAAGPDMYLGADGNVVAGASLFAPAGGATRCSLRRRRVPAASA